MNSKNLLTPRVKSPYKMDKNSDRYRVCPNDGVEFMASHRTRIYCSDQCADEHHNLKKKAEVEYDMMTEIKNALSASAPEKILQSSQPINELPIDKVEANIKIIESLHLDPINGSDFNMDWLASLGYDFSVFSGRGILYNIDPILNCHFMQIGSYRLFRGEYSRILIVKII
jgi:ribosomal protein S27AE